MRAAAKARCSTGWRIVRVRMKLNLVRCPRCGAVARPPRPGRRLGRIPFATRAAPRTRDQRLALELRKGRAWRRRIWVGSLSGEACWIWKRLVRGARDARIDRSTWMLPWLFPVGLLGAVALISLSNMFGYLHARWGWLMFPSVALYVRSRSHAGQGTSNRNAFRDAHADYWRTRLM